jgi:peroxiredoxin
LHTLIILTTNAFAFVVNFFTWKKMKKFIFLFILNFSVYIYSQSVKSTTLLGIISSKIGQIQLQTAYAQKYYSDVKFNQTSKIIDGKFEFKIQFNDTLNYPFIIVIDDSIMSDKFYLNNHDNSLIIDSIVNFTKPKLLNPNKNITRDKIFFENKIKFHNDIFNKKIDSLVKTFKENKPTKENLDLIAFLRNQNLKNINEILYELIKKDNSSQFAFWGIISSFIGNGYKKIYEDSYNEFDYKLKKTLTGSIFINEINKSKALEIGSKFPSISLKDLNFNESNIEFIHLKKKYTLIDFWFSNCKACLASFEYLKPIYNLYKDKNFSLISISTDKTKNLNNWLDRIKNKNLNWNNYLDENGEFAKLTGINAFPTNFLVDSNGIIIAKNISFDELDKLLMKN